MRLSDKKIILLIVIAMLFTIYASYITLQSPLVSFTVQQENEQWEVGEIFESGWASKQAIQSGDIIVQIDGVSPTENSQITKEGIVRTAKSLTLRGSNGEKKEIAVTYDTGARQFIFHLLLPIVYMLLTIYLSTYIYRKRKEDESAFVLILFLLCIALAYGSAAASSRGDIIARIVNALTLTGCLIWYIRFLSVFLKRYQIMFIKQSSLRKLDSLLLLIIVENIIVYFVPSLRNIQSILELGIFCLLLLLSIILLVKNYSIYRNRPGSQAIKLLVFIFVLAFSPFTFLFAIPAVLFSHYFISADLAIISLLIIPISFIYLQLAEQLFDIDFILNRLKYYTLLSFPFSAVICGIISLSLKPGISIREIIGVFIVIFVSSIFFLYAKGWLDYKNRKHMFSTKGNLQTNMYTFFHKIKDVNKVKQVKERILQEMENTLNVQDAIFVDIQQQDHTKAWKVNYTSSKTLVNLTELEKTDWEHMTVGKILTFSKGFAVVVGSEIGTKKIILCNEKKTGTKLNIDEKIWIEMMAYFASVVVENMKLIEGLVEQIDELKLQETNEYPTWLSKLLFALSEKERANLSNDLHDSILQEQLQLLREMDSIHKIVDNQVIKDKLNEMKEQMLDNVHLIRETCMELRPPLLSQQGLKESLQQLIRQTKLRCNFLLYVSIGENIQQSREEEVIFYRIFQELLTNAMKHSNAKKVSIDFYQTDQSIILQYIDDGVGFNLTNEGYSFSSMGLVGIKERIRSIDGNIEIISSKGQGMKVRIEVGTGVIGSD